MTNYSLKAFLTLTPPTILKQYFEKKKYLKDYPWKKEIDIDHLCDTILQSPEAKEIDYDFRTIHQWANDRGIENLIEEARSPIHKGLEIGEELGQLENEYERVMTVFIKYEQVFNWAMEMASWEQQKGKTHYHVGVKLACDGNDKEIIKAMGNAIAEYYKKQSKGSKCLVEYYPGVNPVRHFFFANPEDSVKGCRVYDKGKKVKIIRHTYQPIFQVVYEYNPQDGDLAIHVKGQNAKEKMYEIFCTKTLKLKELPREKEVFDLSCLKNPDFPYEEDKEMPVESITLKMIMLELKSGSNRKITLEANPYKKDNRQVEHMLRKTMTAFGLLPDDIFIRRAKIEIKFKPVNLQKIRPITFTIGAKYYSDLAEDEKSEKAKKYLRKWGIMITHKTKKAVDAA
jgi:hypothetical protein